MAKEVLILVVVSIGLAVLVDIYHAISQSQTPNQPPTANFAISSTNPLKGQTATFDASDSNDPDGQIKDYAWDFGDGNIGSGIKTTHTYANEGPFTVGLTVTDNKGAANSVTKTITVEGLLICDFNAYISRLNTGCPQIKDLGSFYTPGEAYIIEDSVAPEDRGKVLRVRYEIVKGPGGLYIKLKEFNPWGYDYLRFRIRTDRDAGPEKINVELKIPTGKPKAGWFYHYLSGITDSWKTCNFPLVDFTKRENWEGDLELVFTFEEREVVRPEGVIYLDDIAFVKEAPYEGCEPLPSREEPPSPLTLLSIEDPRDDDYGPGTYIRPQHNVFVQEPFDIVKFEVREDEENVIFEFQLSGRIRDVWATKYGLSLQAVDIYLDTKPGGHQQLIFDETIRENLLKNPHGTFNAVLAKNCGWEYAIRGQGWGGAVLFTSPDGLNGNKKSEAAAAWGGSLQVDKSRGIITITVPKSVIGEPESSWNIATFMFSIDRGNARVVNKRASDWHFGGGDDGNSDPNIIDLVLPQGEKPSQEEVLDFQKGPVVLPVINLGTGEIKTCSSP